MTSGILASPPGGRTRYDAYILASSSPDLPEVTDFLAKNSRKPLLRSGSRAQPIPDDAIPTFSSASAIWRSQKAEIAATETPTTPRRPRAKSAFKRKEDSQTSNPRAGVALNELLEPLPEVPTMTREAAMTKKSPDVIVVESSSPIAAKPWKRFKSSPIIVEDHSKAELPEVDITKPARQLKRARKAETVSRHFPPASHQQDVDKSAAPGEVDVIALEPALARRLDWTPPRADTIAHPVSDSPSAREIGPSQDFSPLSDMNGEVFKSLRETYAHRIEEEIQDARPPAEAKSRAPKKRKATEPTETKQSQASKSAPPIKSKGPKKKLRTLTELATAAYAIDSGNGGGAAPTSAAQKAKPDLVLDTLTQDGGDVICQPGHPATKPRKGVKIAKTSKKKAPVSRRRNILLSPSSAMQVSSRQDFVFGTSSQLAREQSPTLLRELHAAMRASNQIEETDPFASPIDSAVATKRTKQGATLWSAGARGSDGELISIDIIDLVDSPSFPDDPLKAVCTATSTENPTRQAQHNPPVANDMDMSNLDVFASPTLNVRRRMSVDRLDFHPEKGDSDPFATSKSDVRDSDCGPTLDAEPPPSNQEVSMLPSHQAQVPLPRRSESAQPRYELFTDAQLSSEVTSYGFKAIKKRTAMIALLEQCWTSRNKGAVQSPPKPASLTTSAAASHPRGKTSGLAVTVTTTVKKKTMGSPVRTVDRQGKHGAPADDQPKRPRGRPRKAPEVAAAPSSTKVPEAGGPQTPNTKRAKPDATECIEIDDSASERLFSSPDGTFSSPAPVDLSVDMESDMSLAMSPTSQQSALFGYISKAITTTPRSNDPLKPSWHEKILMYDPIILEDLAAWLNAGQLDRVGYDCEVSPFDVKRWCESKSVCCLWRVNLNGKERKRV